MSICSLQRWELSHQICRSLHMNNVPDMTNSNVSEICIYKIRLVL